LLENNSALKKKQKMHGIRPMESEDYADIIDLWKRTEGVGLSGEDDSKDSIKLFLDKNPNSCFVAETNNEIIGTIMAGNDGRRGHVYHLTVEHEHRKKGIGRALLKKVEESLKGEGIRKIFLVAFKENKTGNTFWQNNGYEIREDLNYRDKRVAE
jgi:ribosomal protein S18 acetylase RimI-like enzyme